MARGSGLLETTTAIPRRQILVDELSLDEHRTMHLLENIADHDPNIPISFQDNIEMKLITDAAARHFGKSGCAMHELDPDLQKAAMVKAFAMLMKKHPLAMRTPRSDKSFAFIRDDAVNRFEKRITDLERDLDQISDPDYVHAIRKGLLRIRKSSLNSLQSTDDADRARKAFEKVRKNITILEGLALLSGSDRHQPQDTEEIRAASRRAADITGVEGDAFVLKLWDRQLLPDGSWRAFFVSEDQHDPDAVKAYGRYMAELDLVLIDVQEKDLEKVSVDEVLTHEMIHAGQQYEGDQLESSTFTQDQILIEHCLLEGSTEGLTILAHGKELDGAIGAYSEQLGMVLALLAKAGIDPRQGLKELSNARLMERMALLEQQLPNITDLRLKIAGYLSSNTRPFANNLAVCKNQALAALDGVAPPVSEKAVDDSCLF